MSDDSELRLAFYGDDFTGSTDAMDALSRAGVRTALFLQPPDAEQLRIRFGELQAFGVAGTSRAMTPEQMDATLPEIFRRIKRAGARLFHYKVCSTFDSAAHVGSIGRAIDIGQRIFASSFVPLVVGAPALGRYTLFGNHFASVNNANGDDETFRLDRHPTMRRHPATPMRESDLRLHLAPQTDRTCALMDILSLSGTPAEVDARLDAVLQEQPDIVLFDVLDDARLAEVGRLMWTRTGNNTINNVRFVVGSSGVESALTAHWQMVNEVKGQTIFKSIPEVEQLIVVSGSCSPVTREQITTAFEQGFVGISVDTVKLVHSELSAAERERITRHALNALQANRSIIIHTTLGGDDPRVDETANALRARNLDAPHAAEILGRELGLILRSCLTKTNLPRAVVAGGDTSGFVVRELGIDALEMIAPVSQGAPLCRAHSFNDAAPSLQIALKGGQLGTKDYFERVRCGRTITG